MDRCPVARSFLTGVRKPLEQGCSASAAQNGRQRLQSGLDSTGIRQPLQKPDMHVVDF